MTSLKEVFFHFLRFWTFVSAVLGFGYSWTATAAEVPPLEDVISETLKPGKYVTSLAPNEWNPEKSKPLFDASAGLFMDIDPRIQLFHRINKVLAGAVPLGDTEAYRTLRLASEFSVWQRRLKA